MYVQISQCVSYMLISVKVHILWNFKICLMQNFCAALELSEIIQFSKNSNVAIETTSYYLLQNVSIVYSLSMDVPSKIFKFVIIDFFIIKQFVMY